MQQESPASHRLQNHIQDLIEAKGFRSAQIQRQANRSRLSEATGERGSHHFNRDGLKARSAIPHDRQDW
jgi:hypothetical protein